MRLQVTRLPRVSADHIQGKWCCCRAGRSRISRTSGTAVRVGTFRACIAGRFPAQRPIAERFQQRPGSCTCLESNSILFGASPRRGRGWRQELPRGFSQGVFALRENAPLSRHRTRIRPASPKNGDPVFSIFSSERRLQKGPPLSERQNSHRSAANSSWHCQPALRPARIAAGHSLLSFKAC